MSVITKIIPKEIVKKKLQTIMFNVIG